MTFLRATLRSSLAYGGAAAALVVATFASPARAHFTLEEPACWMSQDSLGLPEKLGPCGNEGGGTPTHEVTAFVVGDTITIKIKEDIFHPGHYRVALAEKADRSDLPPEPVVTPGDTPCGTAAIEDPPVFPVLGDGLLVHTMPFPGPQTVHVKLPPNVTCEHCTLQVIEFMSNHPLNDPGGCFYHHCADIKVTEVEVDGGAAGGSGGGSVTTIEESGGSTASQTTKASGGGGAGGSGGAESSSGSCGCATPGGGTSAFSSLAGLALIVAFARRRKKL